MVLVALATLSLSLSASIAPAQRGQPFNANKPKGPELLQPKGLNPELFPKELKTLKDPIPGKNATGAAKDLMSSENEQKLRALESELSARIALL